MYTEFSAIYDRLMRDVDYEAWARYYTRLLAARGIRSGRICECACGTGSLTIPLRKSGYMMTGVDVSEEMLAQAMVKARESGLDIPFVRQDMQNLSLHKPQDAVLSTCDGVNYLLSPAKVKKFLTSAYKALRAGGALIFDVSTPDKFALVLGSQTLTDLTDDTAYIWQNAYNKRTQIISMKLALFIKRADGVYDRVEETQLQRAHTMEELKAWLENAGFKEIRIFGEMRRTAPAPGDSRWHISAIKK